MAHTLINKAPAEVPDVEITWNDAVSAWPINSNSRQPDRCIALLDNGSALARASLWTHSTAPYTTMPTTYIGHIAARDPIALTSLLTQTLQLPARTHPSWLLGPLDGSTWQRYRVSLGPDTTPPFPLEPTNPSWWAAAFTDAGFTPVEHYLSASRNIGSDPPCLPPPPPDGTRIRSLDNKHLAAELDAIYDLAIQAFASNPLYTPISKAAFITMYQPIASATNPEFCLIAEDAHCKPVGVMFAFPADDNRLIFKTIAVANHMRNQGLGTCLLDEIAWRAHNAGFRELIFALMHNDNASHRIVSKMATPFRRYALFGRRLDP